MATTSYTITSSPGYITFTNTAGNDEEINIPVSGLTIHERTDEAKNIEFVHLYWISGNWVNAQDYIKLTYEDVVAPVLASNAALITLLKSLVADSALGGGGEGDGEFLVGKSLEATSEDFSVAFLAATTLTLGAYPSPITGISATDIEKIRQINDVDGAVVQEWNRDDAAMTVVGNILTVANAVFTAADYFVIHTNIPRSSITSKSVDIESGFYVGKSAGTSTDFGVAWTAATQLTLSAYPDALAAFTNADIEWVRQISTAGLVTATYKRDDTTMTLIANVLTITGATLLNTDTFVIMTNIPRYIETLEQVDADPGFYSSKSAGTDTDFTTVYTAATQLTFSNYPAGVSGFTADDILWVKQIATGGATTEVLYRDEYTMSIAANVLSITGATFVNTDSFIVQTSVPRPASAGGSGVGGGESTYSNLQGDFVATINNATKTITITGLSWTLTAESIEKIRLIDTSDIGSTLNILDVAVVGGVITLANVDDFATGDVVAVYLTGPDKNRDAALDVKKVIDQAPDYAHFTDPQPLVADEDLGDNWGNWTDQGTEIPCASYNTLFLYVSVTLADSTLPYMQVLGKHESAGAEEYDLVDFAVVDWTGETTNFLKVYEVPINHGMPYVQVQTKTGIDGDVTTTSTTTAGHTNGIISITYTLGYK